MTNIVTFPSAASLDLGNEIDAIKRETHRLNNMVRQLDRHIDRANAATDLAGEMEGVIVRMTSAIIAMKNKAKPFLKSQAQLDAEWTAFERQWLS
jgi:hypothetical protein